MSLQKMVKGYVTAGDMIDNGNALTNKVLKSKRRVRSGELLKLIAFGDSITDFGDGSSRAPSGSYDMYAQGYWVCATMWSNNEFDVLDGKGISTQTTVNMLARIADVTSSGADICLIMAGTNDIGVGRTPEETRDTMQQIVSDITAAGISVAITPVLHRSDKSINIAIDKLNKYYSDIAKSTDEVVFLDAGYSFNDYIDSSNHTVVSSDRLHPNAFGAYLLGKEVALGLDENFKSWNYKDNIFTNENLEGVSGSLVDGATGELPDLISGGFCDYKSIKEGGENKILATLGTTASDDKSVISIDNLPVLTGERYKLMATLELPSSVNMVDSGCFIRIESKDTNNIVTTTFTPSMAGDSNNSIEFDSVNIATPFFEALAGDTEVKAVLSFEKEGSDLVKLKVSDIRFFQM